MDQLMLLKPTKDFAEEIFKYRMEFIAMGEPLDGTGSLYRMADPNDWLEQVKDLERPERVPEDWVPATQFICVRPYDNHLVGMIQVRHKFNEYLEKYGGLIGYSVLPSQRNKGYGTWMLKNALPFCKSIGLTRVLVTCDPQNVPSRRVIEKNGGVCENTVFDPEEETEVVRYWIDIP